MKHLIPSEEQAEKIGVALTSGARGKDFEVFWYEHRPSRATLFFVQIEATKEIVTFM